MQNALYIKKMSYLCTRFFDVTDGRKKSSLSMLRET